jgi:hypothetical protein
MLKAGMSTKSYSSTKGLVFGNWLTMVCASI